jgi:hypothetical protein
MATLNAKTITTTAVDTAPVQPVALKEWQVLSNGLAVNKPEWRLTLSKPISNGVKVLELSEPSIGAIRKAKKLSVKDDTGEVDEDSQLDMGFSLLSSVTGISVEDLEELKMSDFVKAQVYFGEFMKSFQ